MTNINPPFGDVSDFPTNDFAAPRSDTKPTAPSEAAKEWERLHCSERVGVTDAASAQAIHLRRALDYDAGVAAHRERVLNNIDTLLVGCEDTITGSALRELRRRIEELK